MLLASCLRMGARNENVVARSYDHLHALLLCHSGAVESIGRRLAGLLDFTLQMHNYCLHHTAICHGENPA